ncbi:MAG: hypothetical protein J6T10_14200 [Methanobrevibacter sp.]|nr:hypothetical protein [Methanobrevibacter sp.]
MKQLIANYSFGPTLSARVYATNSSKINDANYEIYIRIEQGNFKEEEFAFGVNDLMGINIPCLMAQGYFNPVIDILVDKMPH